MPTISRFFGILVRMYYADHAPSHFHAHYGEHSAQIAIDSLEVLGGELPSRALGLILEWAVAHRQELRDDWARAQRREPLVPIAPLE